LEEIASLPGQYRVGVNKLAGLLAGPVRDGLKAVLVFGVVSVGRLPALSRANTHGGPPSCKGNTAEGWRSGPSVAVG
jgi:delta-aminolevulinic acid dehydratase/porphobilinogen synthase